MRSFQTLEWLAKQPAPQSLKEVCAASGLRGASPTAARKRLCRLVTLGLVTFDLRRAKGHIHCKIYSVTPAGQASLSEADDTIFVPQRATPPTFRPEGLYDASRDMLKPPARPGSTDAARLPSRMGGRLVWPGGREARLRA